MKSDTNEMQTEVNEMTFEQLQEMREKINARLDKTVYPYTRTELMNKALSNSIIDPDGRVSETDIDDALSELYNKGYISYPRSECNLLPMSYYKESGSLIISILQNKFEDSPLKRLNSIGFYLAPLAFSTKECTHTGIIPREQRLDERLPDIQFHLLKMISVRYIDIFINR